MGLAIANHREEWVGGNVPDPYELFEFAPGIDQERVEAALGGERGDAIARATEIHGVDALAWYVPFHAIGAKRGIYISTAGILYLISRVFQEIDASSTAKLQMSVRALHQHEIFHLARERLTSYIYQFSMAGQGLIAGLSYGHMMPKPFPQSFWVHEGRLCAGAFPGDLDPQTRDAKLRGLLACGIRQVLSLMEEGEKGRNGRPFEPYTWRLAALAAEQNLSVPCVRLPIHDASAPTPSAMRTILDTLEATLRARTPTYLHCWGGHGRTSTVIACHLVEQGRSPDQAIDAVLRWRAGLPKSHYPFEGDQESFVRSWAPGKIR